VSQYALHFTQVSDLIHIERRLVRALARDPHLLPHPLPALYRYAINLAKVGWLRAPGGEDVALGDQVAPLRRWLRDHLLRLLPRHFMPDVAGLLALAPLVAIRTVAMRHALAQRHVNAFSVEDLDHELSHKSLALVLGGGGGSGLAHLGLFQTLHDLNIEPRYIIGSSMGALVGLIRAVRRRYDPVTSLLALPRPSDITQIFRPFSGSSRFGFPGALDLHLLPLARQIFHATLGATIPRFDELPIHLEVMATGIRAGFDPNNLPPQQPSSWWQSLSPLSLHKRLKDFFSTARALAQNPRLLTQVVFNDEPGTSSMRVIEAIGFSCSVPGLLHFDTTLDPATPPHISQTLADLFQRHHLYRLTDGGVINNVPSRVAWTSIQKGKLGHRNAFIYAIDPFAPLPNNNPLFASLQQIARPSVISNRPYSDFTRTFASAPNPILLAPSYKQLRAFVSSAQGEVAPDVPFIRAMMSPLPRFDAWYSHLHLPQALHA
jgi:predicted acylesterase/phospholipase RssA